MAGGGEDVLFQADGKDDLTHSEIWDDSLLIEHYDKAMAQVSLKLAKRTSATNTESEQSDTNPARPQGQHHGTHSSTKKKKKNKKGPTWHVGDYCRAQFTLDGEWYEAVITTIHRHTNHCVVRYLGYNNEDELPLRSLQKSKGETARRRQQEVAACEALSDMDHCSTVADSDHQSDTDGEKNKRQHQQRSRNSPHGMMPPPHHPADGLSTPPPHLPLLPPPPALTMDANTDPQSSVALHTMLMSWYMTGYHTGYYQGLQDAQGRHRRH